MIFLAIDEMQQADCRLQHEAGADDSCSPLHSPVCMPDPAFRQQQDERDDEDARLERAHCLAQRVDE